MMREEEPNGGVYNGSALALKFYQRTLAANCHFTHNLSAIITILAQSVPFGYNKVELHLLICFYSKVDIGCCSPRIQGVIEGPLAPPRINNIHNLHIPFRMVG
jgi:hypothetical protein